MLNPKDNVKNTDYFLAIRRQLENGSTLRHGACAVERPQQSLSGAGEATQQMRYLSCMQPA